MEKLNSIDPRIIMAKINEIITFMNRRGAAFVPPTAQEVEAYAKGYASEHTGMNGNINGEAFCDFYAKKGWKVGKCTMKDWKAAVRCCMRDGWAVNDTVAKTRLFVIPGKFCGECGMPAVYKSKGEYDNYYCLEHSPQSIKDKYN
jgi:hypothetical protein